MKLLVISSYPEKGQIHGAKTVGVGNYTKATLLALVKANPNLKIEVFAENLGTKESYTENKIEVKRFWKRGSVLSLISLFIESSRQETKTILLPFEMFVFGGLMQTAFALPLLLLLKLKGKKIILVLHQVLGGNISTFAKNPIKVAFLSVIRKTFYSYLVFISHKTVVFEQELKERLGNKSKVVVIPHAVIQEPYLGKNVAREKLGLDKHKKYIFYFGYLSLYKGVLELLNIWDEIDNAQLIIGGGGNPNHMNKPEYKTFVDSVMQKAKEKRVITTGFIPEEQMGYYFSAVDIVILPYTVFMSSSGPLSHAFSYGKGIMLSDNLRDYFNSEDMREALEKSHISIDEVCFDLDKPIKNKLLWSLHNLEKLEGFSKEMCRVRSWDLLGQKYNQLLTEVK